MNPVKTILFSIDVLWKKSSALENSHCQVRIQGRGHKSDARPQIKKINKID